MNLKDKIKSVDNLFFPIYCCLRKLRLRFLQIIPNRIFAKWLYYKYTGRKLNLKKPVTYDEKLWWLKFNYKNPLMTICSDKYLVRNYIQDKGLGDILNELYAVFYSPDEIDTSYLPEEFFLKCNHISGWNMICQKSDFSLKRIRRQYSPLLKINYYNYSREWNYKNIKPCLIAEKVLKNPDGTSLLDYKFMCFGGEPKLLLLDVGICDEKGDHAKNFYRNVYDMNFNPVSIKINQESFDLNKLQKPLNFEYMIECARILSSPFPHCRVDLYNIEGKIIFGEITFYHHGGCNNIQPQEANLMMGSWIKLELYNCKDC